MKLTLALDVAWPGNFSLFKLKSLLTHLILQNFFLCAKFAIILAEGSVTSDNGKYVVISSNLPPLNRQSRKSNNHISEETFSDIYIDKNKNTSETLYYPSSIIVMCISINIYVTANMFLST